MAHLHLRSTKLSLTLGPTPQNLQDQSKGDESRVCLASFSSIKAAELFVGSLRHLPKPRVWAWSVELGGVRLRQVGGFLYRNKRPRWRYRSSKQSSFFRTGQLIIIPIAEFRPNLAYSQRYLKSRVTSLELAISCPVGRAPIDLCQGSERRS